jgi:hypothetical protein
MSTTVGLLQGVAGWEGGAPVGIKARLPEFLVAGPCK